MVYITIVPPIYGEIGDGYPLVNIHNELENHHFIAG